VGSHRDLKADADSHGFSLFSHGRWVLSTLTDPSLTFKGALKNESWWRLDIHIHGTMGITPMSSGFTLRVPWR